MSRRSTRGAPAPLPARGSASLAATPTPGPSFPASSLPQPLSLPPDAPFADQYRTLRTHWKWANFSQFFFTFAPLFNMPDVSIVDIEDDLARGTNIVLPRVMCRLMTVLMQDRKLTVDTWQASMRRQYLRRDPDKNPLGPPPALYARTASPELEAGPSNTAKKEDDDKNDGETADTDHGDEAPPNPQPDGEDVEMKDADDANEPKPDVDNNATAGEPVDEPKEEEAADDGQLKSDEPAEEPRDWNTLPMLEKLDSMVLLTEWQFQNQARFRQTMKSDDDFATWRIEPIGYDAKSNAYWLIGADRLWIQRNPPRPPRPLKRKRAPPKKKAPSPSPSVPSELSEPEEDLAPKRPRRAASNANAKKSNGRAKGKGRAAEVEPEPDEEVHGRGSRKAKTQANAKLDAQAKELAALQRQAALEKRRGPAPAATISAAAQSPRATRGTRVSARLRGAETEWQDVPAEWLADGEKDDAEDEAAKTGLEDDDAVSELSSLSDLSELEPEPEPEPEEEVVEEEKPAPRTRRAPAKSKGKGKKKAPARARRAKAVVEAEDVVEEVEEKQEPEEEWKPPADWIEWEAIAITLREWEVVAEPFAKATHYTEKALYKRLTNEIVPIVVGAMREAEKKRLLEESVQSRKRSSRLVAKEHEAAEIKAAAEKAREEEERMARSRRAEAREKKEAEERERRENAREARRREREEREERRRKMTEAEHEGNATTGDEDGDVDVDGEQEEEEESEPESEPAKKTRKRKRAPAKSAPAADAITTSASKPRAKRTPKEPKDGEHQHQPRARKSSGKDKNDWVLACELCNKTAKDTSVQLVQCVTCQRWQHIACHDAADARAGRPKRDWRRVQFRCARCAPLPGQPVPLSVPGQGHGQHGRYATGPVGVQAYGVRGYAEQPGAGPAYPGQQAEGARYANGARGFVGPGTNGMGPYTPGLATPVYGPVRPGSGHFGSGLYTAFGNGNTGSPFGGPTSGATIYSARAHAHEQNQAHSQSQVQGQSQGHFAAQTRYPGYPQAQHHQAQAHPQQPHPHASQQAQHAGMSIQDQQAYIQQREQFAYRQQQAYIQSQQLAQQQQALRQQQQQQQQQPAVASEGALAYLAHLAQTQAQGQAQGSATHAAGQSMSPHSSMPGTPHTPQQASNGFFQGGPA
ncbi:unnamed protein product [Peniophora sp. CBMAI 1063]|nr:unnamed protein product [Peniophora sp. CBMAI 1063]